MTTISPESAAEGRHDERVFAIIVNGRKIDESRRVLSFEDVVRLAFPTPPTGENIEFTVTYRKAAGDKHDGTLQPRGTVKVKDGTIFNVTATDKS